MPHFQYQGRSAGGDKVEGRLEGASLETVVAQLQSQRIVPIRIEEVHEPAAKKDWMTLRLRKPRVTLDDLAMFCRQMYALTRAGIPIVQAVSGLAEMSRSEVLKDALQTITSRLRSGVSLATAMQEHNKVFSSIFVSLVHVGENTGRLDEAFRRLMQHIELERETGNRVSQALRYPTIVFSAMVIAMAIINLFVIPNFSKVFKKLGHDLPLPTQILMKTSEFTVNYWWAIVLVAGVAAMTLVSYIKTEPGRLQWDRIKLRIPIIGSILNKIALSRFTRSFAMMAESGVPIVQSLGIVGSTLGNRYIESSISSIRRGIERGDSLARSAAATQMFTPLILQMIAVGEETGALDKLLHDVSDFYEEEVDFQLKKLADAIEPIVLAFMGALVLVLALGVFLPMWELGSAMRK